MKLDIDNPKSVFEDAKMIVAKPEFRAAYDLATERANELAGRISKMGGANVPDSMKKELRWVTGVVDQLCDDQFMAEATESFEPFDGTDKLTAID